MDTNDSPKMQSQETQTLISTLNERDRRLFLAHQATVLQKSGVPMHKITKDFGTSKNTIYRGRRELASGAASGPRIRQRGGGRKRQLEQHPEWVGQLLTAVEPMIAGLPQDAQVVWVSMTVPRIQKAMAENGCEISQYHVRQILNELGFRKRSFAKDLPMREAADRDAQFVNIGELRRHCAELGIPIISIDTKKKELIGNFKRDGTVLCKGTPRSFDHDFETFASGKIVPHGIYDIAANMGYLTIGTSHDTSEFVCDNIQRVWEQELRQRYPTAKTVVILCDGGGSNSSSHHIVKQDLMDLADRIDIKIVVAHYPPYCSKYNPIEHRLFSQITRSWSGAPLLSVEDAANRAAMTTTKTGLTVKVFINRKDYQTKRILSDGYKQRLKRQFVTALNLPKWNYLIKPS